MCAQIDAKPSLTIEQSNLVIQLAGSLLIYAPQKIRIEQQINEHAALFFRAAVKDAEIEKYQNLVELETTILVYPRSNAGNPLDPKCPQLLFQGVATKIEVYHDDRNGGDYVDVYGWSHTCRLDFTREKRSFQNKQLTLRQMVNQVTEPFGAVGYMDAQLGDKPLGQFTLLHNETVWNYLKRQASLHGQTFLVANAIADHPVFYMGMPLGYERQLDTRCRNYSEFGIVATMPKN